MTDYYFMDLEAVIGGSCAAKIVFMHTRPNCIGFYTLI